MTIVNLGTTQLLTTLTSTPRGDGVSLAMAKFLTARCKEEQGDREVAVALYKEAAAADTEVATDDGVAPGVEVSLKLAVPKADFEAAKRQEIQAIAQQKVDETLAKVRPSIPPELQGDLKVVGDTYARAAKAGLLNASHVLSDPAFKKSNKAVGDWLTTQCGAPGTGGN